MTKRLFDEDPYRTKFAARVTARTEGGVVLDQTCFFPTGGGQPHDTGTLNGVRVVDVVEEGSRIVHRTKRPVDGDAVEGEIDWGRRRDHMQQHHGQHLLSEAFVRVAGAQTESFHLGADACSIDLSRDLTDRDVEAAEEAANEVVWGNREVRIGFFTPEEASKKPLRKPPPEGESRLRIVEVEGFDCQPCCGTHPRRTGEVGWILVLGREKNRIHFVCGHRALARARGHVRKLRALSQALSAPFEELEAGVERLRRESVDRMKALQAAGKELARFRARELAANAKEGRVVEILEGADMKTLQTLANEIIAAKAVALLGSAGERASIVLAAPPELGLDLRPALAEALAVLGGKGGGKPHFVQGGGQGDVRAALEKALAHLEHRTEEHRTGEH